MAVGSRHTPTVTSPAHAALPPPPALGGGDGAADTDAVPAALRQLLRERRRLPLAARGWAHGGRRRAARWRRILPGRVSALADGGVPRADRRVGRLRAQRRGAAAVLRGASSLALVSVRQRTPVAQGTELEVVTPTGARSAEGPLPAALPTRARTCVACVRAGYSWSVHGQWRAAFSLVSLALGDLTGKATRVR
jgi:hypothetical protein